MTVTPAPDPVHAIDSEFKALESYLQAAVDIMRDGHMPDLGGLDRRIAGLCKDVLSLPEERRGGYRDRMQALLERIDLCAASLQVLHALQNPAATGKDS